MIDDIFGMGDMFSGSARDTAPLDGLHVSRAGDFYWPDPTGGVAKHPPAAPPLTAGQIRERVQTDEIRRAK